MLKVRLQSLLLLMLCLVPLAVLAQSVYVDSNTVFHVGSGTKFSADTLEVAASGTLSGEGIVAATTTVYGTVSPSAHTAAVLTINGDLSLQPGSVYECVVDPDTNATRLVVQGGTVSGSAMVQVNNVDLNTAPYNAVIIDGGPGSDYAGFSAGGHPSNQWELTPIPVDDLALTEDNVDADGDGIADSWELHYGYNPGDPEDAVLDLDDDASSTLEEYVGGTEPDNIQSYFFLFDLTLANPPFHQLQFDSVYHRTYHLERATKPDPSAWMDEPVPPVAGDGTVKTFVYDAGSVSRSLYRVRVEKN